jgi:thioredoxin-like negative regulator of GroEL
MGFTPLTDLNFHQTLSDVTGTALVLVGAAHCGACKQLKTVLHRYQNTENALPIFEVDAVMNGGIIQALTIFHLPALFLYVDGHYHRKIQCEATLPALQTAIQQALMQAAEEEP